MPATTDCWMPEGNATMRTIRVARDFLIGLALFGLICGVNLAEASAPASTFLANAARAAVLGNHAEPSAWSAAEARASVHRHKHIERDRALAILALVFSGFVAFNLWFARHLRRVYASPRRGGWRRG